MDRTWGRLKGVTILKSIFRYYTIVLLFLAVACMPGAGEISGATNKELDGACAALRRVGYDYWSLNVVAVGGRTLEVSADIHFAHPGPQQTREYCEGR